MSISISTLMRTGSTDERAAGAHHQKLKLQHRRAFASKIALKAASVLGFY